jgi:predicted TIM-barrel fold metal-dependent hydrolase
MLIDVHVHVCALAGGGHLSEKRISSVTFRFMRRQLGISGPRPTWQDQLERVLAQTISGALDAAVVLAFDAVYDRDGTRRDDLTDMLVENDYVAALSRHFPQMLFGASVHPYRKDAVAELERCINAGAVLVKWLPLTQQMDPADEQCIPLYEAMAHYNIPLLCHTGGEKTLKVLDKSVRDPRKLALPLQRGVKVIAAHCATRSIWGEHGYLDEFCAMARDHEHLYGDTAAITLPNRSYCLDRILGDDAVRRKLVHGSDWPVISAPTLGIGWRNFWAAWREGNWMKRDVMVKRALGFDEAYFTRAASILRMPSAQRNSGPRSA